HREGARPHLRTDLMPYQPAVDETQRGVRLEAKRLMRIKVHRVPAAHTQDATAPGLPCFHAPERRGTMERPGRERHTSYEAGLEQITTAHTPGHVGMSLWHDRRSPSLCWVWHMPHGTCLTLSSTTGHTGADTPGPFQSV